MDINHQTIINEALNPHNIYQKLFPGYANPVSMFNQDAGSIGEKIDEYITTHPNVHLNV